MDPRMASPAPDRPSVTLKAGHVQPVWSGHPWIYAQAVERVLGGARPGDEVSVLDPRGNFLGVGFYNPRSAIVVRLFSRHAGSTFDGAFLRERLHRAVELRRGLHLPSAETNAFRVVHAEGDGLPGLILDRFDDVVAVQLTTLGMKLREGLVLEAIHDVLAPKAILDRTPAEIGRIEGFESTGGVLRGELPRGGLHFLERGLRYELPPGLSQKTGFYFDQRPLRTRVEALSKGKRVLDAFAFVGTFSLAAARGGAREVVAVEENALALETGAELARLNGLAEVTRFIRGDARSVLRQAAEDGGFELVVCDPPKMAPTRASREEAILAYQKLAALACRAVTPGGVLVFCSCSAAISLDALIRAVALGARDARRQATVLERFFQGVDHPVPAAFPEGVYLKSLLLRIEE